MAERQKGLPRVKKLTESKAKSCQVISANQLSSTDSIYHCSLALWALAHRKSTNFFIFYCNGIANVWQIHTQHNDQLTVSKAKSRNPVQTLSSRTSSIWLCNTSWLFFICSRTDVILKSADCALAKESCAIIELRCRDVGVDTACIGDSATDDGVPIPNFDKSSSE